MTEKKGLKALLLKKVAIYSVSILLLLLLILFLKSRIEKETESIIGLRTETEQNKIFLSNLIKIQKEEKKAEKYQKILKALVPEDPNFLSLAYQAKYVARKSGVDFNFNFARQKEGDILINFSLKGSQGNVLSFLKLLKKAPFFLSLDKLTWSKDEGKGIGVVGSGHFYFYQGKKKT